MLSDKIDEFFKVMKNTMGASISSMNKEEFNKKFWEWAASWDAT